MPIYIGKEPRCHRGAALENIRLKCENVFAVDPFILASEDFRFAKYDHITKKYNQEFILLIYIIYYMGIGIGTNVFFFSINIIRSFPICCCYTDGQ